MVREAGKMRGKVIRGDRLTSWEIPLLPDASEGKGNSNRMGLRGTTKEGIKAAALNPGCH